MWRKKWLGIVLIVLILLAGGGYLAYVKGWLPWVRPRTVAVGTPTLKTSTVTVGNISITADGSGVLVPSTEVNLGFSSSGTLAGLQVEVGDRVKAGDVLAWIDDTEARNAVIAAELAVIEAQKALEKAGDTASLKQAVAQAQFQVAQLEANLAAAQADLDELLNWAPDSTEVEIARANLTIAQISYQNTLAKANMRDQELASTRIKLEQAIQDLKNAQDYYIQVMDSAKDWERNIADTRARAAENVKNAQNNLEIAQASYDLAQIDSRQIDIENARIKVLNAQKALDDLQTPPDEQTIASARLKVQELQVSLAQARLNLADAQAALAEVDTAQAELNLQQAQLKLELAQKALAETTLTAPIDGTVVSVNGRVGDKVSGTVIVLADLNTPLIKFWVEESDLNNIAVGNRVKVVFEALPDLSYNGQIVSIDPMLTSVGNTTAVQAWASIDTSAYPVKLLGNMNAEVEIVAGEALNALLVPVQALREIADGQYAVFVVLPNGELELRTVEIGLKDYVNAQVLSGLQRGDVVSLGDGSSSSSTQSTTPTNTNRNQNMMEFPGGGGMPPMMPGG